MMRSDTLRAGMPAVLGGEKVDELWTAGRRRFVRELEFGRAIVGNELVSGRVGERAPAACPRRAAPLVWPAALVVGAACCGRLPRRAVCPSLFGVYGALSRAPAVGRLP